MTKYMCADCGGVFDEEDITVCVCKATLYDPPEYEWQCPVCGGDEFEEAEECQWCREYFVPDGNRYYCKECRDEFNSVLDVFFKKCAVRWQIGQDSARDAVLSYLAEVY